MPRKKSVKKSARDFATRADAISDFVSRVSTGQRDGDVSWIYDHAIIRLYREFENLMLQAAVGAINNDTAALADVTGVRFPRHLKDDVCEYLVVGSGYFDFKGRDGLIRLLRRYLPSDHYLILILKKPKYRDSMERLSALRNFAAHGSSASKRTVLAAIRQRKIASSGKWLSRQGRFSRLKARLKELAQEIEDSAPY